MEAKRIPVSVPQPPDVVQLTLSLEEAQLLRKLLGHIGGQASALAPTRRYYDLALLVHDVLGRAGVESSDQQLKFELLGLGRGVRVIDVS